MAVSLHTSQSGPRALFPPLTAFFESPYEKGPNWSGQSINKDQQLLLLIKVPDLKVTSFLYISSTF